VIQQSLEHPALSEYSRIWSLSSVPQLHHFTYAIDDVANRQLVLDVIGTFQSEVLPNIAQFRAGFSTNILLTVNIMLM